MEVSLRSFMFLQLVIYVCVDQKLYNSAQKIIKYKTHYLVNWSNFNLFHLL